jgi:CRP/FNR family transcriptional regulator, cyclic AMP receptor protein
MSVYERYDRRVWAPGSLLALLSASQQEVILALGQTRQYNAGETVFNQGESSQFIAIIIDGYVKISAVSDSGIESLLAIRTAGDVIGELSAMDGLPRSAAARAADAVLAQVIMKSQLDRCLEDNFGIGRAFNQAVGAKLRAATKRRVEFRRDTRGRLAQVLMDLCHDYAEPGHSQAIAVTITQSELAGLIGASEPAVHKAIRAMRDAEVIGTGYGRLVIEDIAALRRLAERCE